MIKLADFKNVEFRTAKILEVEEIPGADKIWKLRIDVGAEKKSIVAGIKAFYTKEALLGKNIVIVNNLEPAVIRGVESQGMLLAAKDGSKLTILTIDGDVPAGSAIG